MMSSNADNTFAKISDCQMTELVMQPYNSKLVVTVSKGRVSILDPTSLSTSTVSPIFNEMVKEPSELIERKLTIKCVDDKNLFIFVTEHIPLGTPFVV
jgi:hypothetical protein